MSAPATSMPLPEELQREVDTVLSELLDHHKSTGDEPINHETAVQYWAQTIEKVRFYTGGTRQGYVHLCLKLLYRQLVATRRWPYLLAPGQSLHRYHTSRTGR